MSGYNPGGYRPVCNRCGGKGVISRTLPGGISLGTAADGGMYERRHLIGTPWQPVACGVCGRRGSRADAFWCNLTGGGWQIWLRLAVWARVRSGEELPPAGPPPGPSPLRSRGVNLLGHGCVRFANGRPWILNRREDGWGSFGFECADWDELFRRYNVAVVAHGTDEHGEWWGVENCRRQDAPAHKGGPQ